MAGSSSDSPKATGYRYFLVDGVDRRGHAAGGVMGNLASSTEDDVAESLLGPFSLLPWGRGWQAATCARRGAPAAPDCDCGIAVFPRLDQLVRFLTPAPATDPSSGSEPPRARSLAMARVDTRGPWQPDRFPSAPSWRAPEARLAEVWLSPEARQPAEAIAAEYGVTVHGSAPGTSFIDWLRSL